MNWRIPDGGMIDVELTCSAPEMLWKAFHTAGMKIHHLEKKDELTFECSIQGKEYRKIEALCNKKGASIKIKKRSGWFWFIYSALRRPIIIAALCGLFLFTAILPTKILFIRVEGNDTVAVNRILEGAEQAGIHFGASRREVRSEKIKNDLLEQLPQLRWAGINTIGCTAIISVRERAVSEEVKNDSGPTNIIASIDGYILSGTVEEGNALFQVGQTVKSGQVLISGYTDHGVSISSGPAQGEIYAETNRMLTGITPSNCLKKNGEEVIGRKFSLIYQKKRINLWKDSGISEGTCGRMYKEYYINLPGGFALPITFCIETYYSFSSENYFVTQEDAEEVLCLRANDYLTKHMIAGEILKKTESVQVQEGIFQLNASYSCREMIGKEQEIQIGDTNGKAD